jgi:hypothetical protein
MIWLSALLNLVTKRRNSADLAKRPQPFRPALESLETRDAPSGLAHATEFNMFLDDTTGKGQGEGVVTIGGHGHNVIYLPGN